VPGKDEVNRLGNFIDKMERKLGRFAIPNLMLYVSILNVIGYVIWMINPLYYLMYFSLDVRAVLHGQIWRLVTFMMVPSDTRIIFFVISLYFYIYLGRTLEGIWGAFKFNLYYFTGIIGTILAAFIAYFVTGHSLFMGTVYLNISMFLAFAVVLPDMQVLLMFLIPVKVKWLAYLDALMLLGSFVMAVQKRDYGTCIAIIVAMLNFLIFFFGFMRRNYSPKQFIRRQKFKRAAGRGYAGQGPSFSHSSYGGGQTRRTGQAKKITRHQCAVCGRSELDGDDLEFRFCSKCNGNYEYCQDHLFTHTHVR